jgi:hypothetical protein
MTQDMTGFQADLRAMKQELLAAIAEVRSDVAGIDKKVQGLQEDIDKKVQGLQGDVAGIDKKVQYLCDHLLGDADQKELRRAVGGR